MCATRFKLFLKPVVCILKIRFPARSLKEKPGEHVASSGYTIPASKTVYFSRYTRVPVLSPAAYLLHSCVHSPASGAGLFVYMNFDRLIMDFKITVRCFIDMY